MRTAGHPTASLDLQLGEPIEGKQDAFDLLSDAGFLSLALFPLVTEQDHCSLLEYRKQVCFCWRVGCKVAAVSSKPYPSEWSVVESFRSPFICLKLQLCSNLTTKKEVGVNVPNLGWPWQQC